MDNLGELSKTLIADKKTQQDCDVVKKAAEVKTDKHYAVFTAICYKSQLVAGTNFFIKVHVGGSDCIHLRVFEALPCNGGGLTLGGVQEGKALDDPIIYF
ncbi:unnamed protein product [Lota lota]